MSADTNRILLALVMLLAWAPARAQDAAGKLDISVVDIQAPLLDLSVDAVTRRTERASEAPAAVFVLTADDIRRNGFRTLNELLGSVPGMFSYPGNFPQTGVRGMGILGDFTTRLLVLIDGHPLANAVGIDLGRGMPLPLDAIRRVEVIKGPVGSVYGPSAFFGVVNLVTTGAAGGGEVRAGGEGNQGSVRGGEGSVVWRSGGELDAVVAADVYATRGQDWPYPELAELGTGPNRPDASGTKRNVDHRYAGSGYGRFHWRALDVSAACSRASSGLPTASAYADPRTELQNLVCFGELAAQFRVGEKLTLKSRASFDHQVWRTALGYPGPPADVGLYHLDGEENWATAEVRADWRPFEIARLDLGATLQLHRATQSSYADEVPAIEVQLLKRFVTVNTWLLGQVKVGGGVTLHGGATFFAHSLFGNRVSPKVAAVWQASRDDTVKAIWSMGFRPPTMVEAFVHDNLSLLANPDLKPETVSSAELLYEHRFGDLASVSGSFFWNEYRDLIRSVLVPLPNLGRPPDSSVPSDFGRMAVNAGALRVLGGELAITLRWGDWLQGYGGVSVQQASQEERPNFPAVTGNLSLSTRALWRPLLLTVAASAISPRDYVPASPLIPVQRLPASVSLGGLAALDVPGVQGLTLEVSVVNALDRRNRSPAPPDSYPITALPEAARTVRADVRWRF